MASPYVHERQVEYWTSREIEDFLLDAGYDILVFPITQLLESKIPADFLFLDTSTNKLFGLQYKALYGNASDFWNVAQHQHTTLSNFDWIYYALSDLKDARQRRNALHYLRLVTASFAYRSKIVAAPWDHTALPAYSRWAAFYEGLKDCSIGRKITARADLISALWPAGGNYPPEVAHIVDDVFIVNPEQRRAVVYSAKTWEPERG